MPANNSISRYEAARCPALLLAFLVLLSACEVGPPVQEMSDARMAIAVARDAGAAILAPDELRAAESLLNSARLNLSRQAYAEARVDAVEAKNRALDALESAESADGDNPRR